MSSSVQHVRIREVGPRDGFQNEPEVIPTPEKVRLIELLARTGLQRLEVPSFVRPEVIRQLSDAREVLEAIDVPEDVALSVLIPNERGLEHALELRDRFHEINVFMSATDSHWTAASAPGPVISNFANDVWSIRPTPLRTAWCAAPTASNQFG